MENVKIKKVMVELTDGTALEFDKQAIVFVEDDMTETERKLHTDNTKLCSIIGCSSSFMATAATSLLSTLAENVPGLDSAVIAKHLDGEGDIIDMLEKILG